MKKFTFLLLPFLFLLTACANNPTVYSSGPAAPTVSETTTTVATTATMAAPPPRDGEISAAGQIYQGKLCSYSLPDGFTYISDPNGVNIIWLKSTYQSVIDYFKANGTGVLIGDSALIEINERGEALTGAVMASNTAGQWYQYCYGAAATSGIKNLAAEQVTVDGRAAVKLTFHSEAQGSCVNYIVSAPGGGIVFTLLNTGISKDTDAYAQWAADIMADVHVNM